MLNDAALPQHFLLFYPYCYLTILPPSRLPWMLTAARLRHVAGTVWSSKKYLNMELLTKRELCREDAA
jgi:hypothetical protein